MDYELIYYIAGRTAETERILDKMLSPLGLSHSAGAAATNKSELADSLAKSLIRSQLIFIIGGLSDGYDSTDKILSKILVSNDANVFSKRIDGESVSGYIIRSKAQTIVVLPDNPDEIETMLNDGIIPDLAKTYNLVIPDDKIDIKDVVTKLDSELAGAERVRLVSAPPKPKLYKRSRRAKLIIGIFLGAGLALAITAVILTIIYYILPYSN